MVFSSIIFLAYFLPLVLLIYFSIPRSWRNGFLLLASIVFYSWGAPKFIFVILLTTMLDFFLVGELHRARTGLARKLLLVLSVSMNLGLLFYFKYCNFFIENANRLLSQLDLGHIPVLAVVLPIGISFYTFESLTYVIDVYRGVHKPLRNFWHYQLYIILFPKLIAGPIIRYHEIADQITDRSATDNGDHRIAGFFRFVIGLSKKVFIANTLAEYADNAFEYRAEDLTAGVAWLGVLCYAFQIYFDFSGYSDMAIGLGRMFGFKFPENFDNPYTSGSVTEFWQRWHITLGRWMKNYLYIPLGGNRSGARWRVYLNLWIVFIASGLWHGADWTFIAWGAYHGTFLVLERIFLLKMYDRAGRWLSVPVTFVIVVIGWIPFRAESLAQAATILRRMFSFSGSFTSYYTDAHFRFYLFLAALFSFFIFMPYGKRIQERIYSPVFTPAGSVLATVAACLLVTLAIAAVAASDFNPFIYFRF